MIFPVEETAGALEGSLTGLDPNETYIPCGFERSFFEGNKRTGFALSFNSLISPLD